MAQHFVACKTHYASVCQNSLKRSTTLYVLIKQEDINKYDKTDCS
jgi:hypothetical protein